MTYLVGYICVWTSRLLTSLWMTSILGHSTSFHKRTEVLQHHHGKEVMLPDAHVCLLAESVPQVSVLNELECMLRACFCVISYIAVTSIDDLCAQACDRGPHDRLVLPHGFGHGQAKAFAGRALEDNARITLERIHFRVSYHRGIVQQMDIWI